MSAQREIETPRTMAFFSRPDISIDAAKAHSINLERELAEAKAMWAHWQTQAVRAEGCLDRSERINWEAGFEVVYRQNQKLTDELASLRAKCARMEGVLSDLIRFGERGSIQIHVPGATPRYQSREVWQFPIHHKADIEAALAETPAPKSEGGEGITKEAILRNFQENLAAAIKTGEIGWDNAEADIEYIVGLVDVSILEAVVNEKGNSK